MKRAKGDLWSFHPTHWIVVPTNLGWSKSGNNVMGAGVAEQARERFPHLPATWGSHVQLLAHGRSNSLIAFDTLSRCIFFPTKPLDRIKPALSWKSPASLSLIETAVAGLQHLVPIMQIWKVALPLVGCGYGGLSREQVLPILERLDDNFTLVER